jgi:hypothetical protein
VIAVLVALIPFFLVPDKPNLKNGTVLTVTAFCVALCIGAVFALRRKSLSYVGEEGIAHYYTRGTRTAAKPQILRFTDAAAIKTAQVNQYYNGIYTGTSYDFSFYSPARQRIWRLNGTHREKKKVKANTALNFLVATEHAWNRHFLKRVQGEFEKTGGVTFLVDNAGHSVRLLPGAIELHFKGEPVRLTPADIKSLGLNQGSFHIHTHDAKWFSGKGKFHFQYGQMDNAQAFLIALESLVGFQFGSDEPAK